MRKILTTTIALIAIASTASFADELSFELGFSTESKQISAVVRSDDNPLTGMVQSSSDDFDLNGSPQFGIGYTLDQSENASITIGFNYSVLSTEQSIPADQLGTGNGTTYFTIDQFNFGDLSVFRSSAARAESEITSIGAGFMITEKISNSIILGAARLQPTISYGIGYSEISSNDKFFNTSGGLLLEYEESATDLVGQFSLGMDIRFPLNNGLTLTSRLGLGGAGFGYIDSERSILVDNTGEAVTTILPKELNEDRFFDFIFGGGRALGLVGLEFNNGNSINFGSLGWGRSDDGYGVRYDLKL